MSELEVRWSNIEELRRAGSQELDGIARAAGPDSPLHLLCQEAWRLREADARISVRFGDVANAEVILDRGVHSLRHALEAARGERIPVEELFALISSC